MENNKQQTAVEWLVEKLNKYNEEMVYLYAQEIREAKAMHKEEIVNAYANGDNDGYRYMNNQKQEFEHGEQYYKQTFGGNNE